MEDNWRQEFKLHQLQMEYDDDLVQAVAQSLQHEGLIDFYLHDPIAFLKNFPQYGWDEESDRMAEEFLLRYLEIYEPGTAHDIVQQTIADLTNDERESAVAIDLDTGDQVFVRIGDGDSVALQDFHQKLAEGRNILVIHNHPNSTGASLADLGVAEWLDAEFMIVVRPDGYQHGYVGGEDGMARLAPSFNPDYLAAADPKETVAATFGYWIQSLLEIGNPAERVMRQGSNDAANTINTDSRFVSEFLLNPSGVVFLDDLANEYGVEDPSFYSAMVSTIIYRELGGFASLQVAGIPGLQSLYDTNRSCRQHTLIPFAERKS